MNVLQISLLFLFLPSAIYARPRSAEDMSGAILRSRAYETTIRDAAARYSVDQRLLWTIAYLESRFRPGLVSPRGARGMMQFMPATGRRYGLRSTRPCSINRGRRPVCARSEWAVRRAGRSDPRWLQ